MRVTRHAGAFVRVMPRDRQRRPDGRPFIDLRPGERPSERRPLVTDAHLPVMVDEIVELLRPALDAGRPVIVDATLGAGGHAEALLRAFGGGCTLIGIDRDPSALARAQHRLEPFGDSLRLVRSGFEELAWVVRAQSVGSVDAIVMDLGMSSIQVDDPRRGFSYRFSGPLDMRMDPTQKLTAADVVNGYSERELERVLQTFGEERNARRIAAAIATARRKSPIRTTTQLASIVIGAYPPAARKHTFPARKTFQAIRIEVNEELDSLERALRAVPSVLRPGGRVAVVSYHSLEDKLVKKVFAEMAEPSPQLPGLPAPVDVEPELRVLTSGARLPSKLEVARNPRASSARLRVAERLEPGD